MNNVLRLLNVHASDVSDMFKVLSRKSTITSNLNVSFPCRGLRWTPLGHSLNHFNASISLMTSSPWLGEGLAYRDRSRVPLHFAPLERRSLHINR